MIILKLLLPSFIIIGGAAFVALYIWIMDPIMHFTSPPGPDLSSTESYLVVDKYDNDPSLQPSVNFTVIFPAYNEVKAYFIKENKALNIIFIFFLLTSLGKSFRAQY